MKIQKLIKEQEQQINELLEGGQLTLEGNGITPVDVTQEIKSFMKSYERKLIEAVAEELVGESEKPLFSERYKCKGSEEKTLRKRGRNELRDMQRLKLKEIIKSLEK